MRVRFDILEFPYTKSPMSTVSRGKPMSPTKWLETHAPGYKFLTSDERQTISDFSLLWSLFEFKLLDTRGSAKKICEKVDTWQAANEIENLSKPELEYFRARYMHDGDFSYHFGHLNFQKSDKIQLVKSVLKNQEVNGSDSLKACLVIVYRYRNNLFHGPKWAYGIKDQQDNLGAANSI